ncbi:MAG TPA: hypothetical protein VM889_10005 [Candidatus Thermoplasmatota archaeon]|nr:hypothetical protein [Candidatus Thermoplasmatota archaeon]
MRRSVDAPPAARRALAALARRRRALRRSLPVVAAGLVIASAAAWAWPAAAWELRAASVPDADGDRVPDVVENAVLGRDPFRPSAPERLPDAWIERFGLDPGDPGLAERVAPYPRPPESPAVYGPGGLPVAWRMSLGEVYAHGRPAGHDETEDGPWWSGLDPTRWDVDGRGVPYAWLIAHGFDPLDPTVIDRRAGEVPWTVGEAWTRGLDPRRADGDADGLDDLLEIALGTDPRAFSTSGSGLADGWLAAHGFDLFDAAVAFEDTDLDGLTNLQEFEASRRLYGDVVLAGGGLDPRRAASGGASVPDGWLVAHGFDPLAENLGAFVTERGVDPVDGSAVALTLLDEYAAGRPLGWNESSVGPWWGGSDPRSNDTDGDGLTDLAEIVGWKVGHGSDARRVRSDPTRRDTDADGLDDAVEFAGRLGSRVFPRTDPARPDTDGDGLLDGEEVGARPWRGLVLPALDPTVPDSDEDGLDDGVEADYWMRRVDVYRLGRLYEWGPDPRPRGLDLFGSDGLAALGPAGDLDGDGRPNLLDRDADDDGLADGWEVDPTSYRESPFASDRKRPATDPARNDTDMDGLPDAWEIRFGIYDDALGGWNLDPSLWSSFHDGLSDAERDLDHDVAVWTTIVEMDGRRVARAQTFRATNLAEYEAGSDPNRRSSSPDGLADGWKIFWGTVYLGLPAEDLGVVYPGAPGPLTLPADRPIPRIGRDDGGFAAPFRYTRVQPVPPGTLLAWERFDGPPIAPALRRVVGEGAYGYRAAEANGTHPYLDDSDGDGLPDAWESAWRRLSGDGLSPLAPDADLDPDSDGLPTLAEYHLGTSPFAADTDGGGAPDADEASVRFDPLDPADDDRLRRSSTDTDGDGLTDVEELLGFAAGPGRARVRTDPRDPDTDRDGLLDGRSLSEVLGRAVRPRERADDASLVANLAARGLIVHALPDGSVDILGELSTGADPTRLSTGGDGVPDGWAVLHGFSPAAPTGAWTAYAAGRPAWWEEALHGPWRWGLAPGEKLARDRDEDGLDDGNGEDPWPANQRNRLVAGDPRDVGLPPLERLRRAQAVGDDPADRTRPLPPRAQVRVTLDLLGPALALDGTAPFAGAVATVSGESVANATVILSAGRREHVLGAAVTDARGAFEGRARLASEVDAPAGSSGVAVFADDAGAGRHRNDLAQLAAHAREGGTEVFAWVYNVSPFASGRAAGLHALPDGTRRAGFLGADSPRQTVSLVVPARLTVEGVSTADAGARIRLTARLEDGFGRPLAGEAVLADAAPGGVLVTGADGAANVSLALPSDPGTFRYAFSFAGREGALLATAAEHRVTALAPVRLILEPPPFAPRPGASFAIAGRLTDAGGSSLEGATVAWEFLDFRGRETTGPEGRFRVVLDLPADAPLGASDFEARFAGGALARPAASRLVLHVAGDPRLEATPVAARDDEAVTVRVRLVDAEGKPMPRRTIALERNATAETDGQGIARFSFPGGAFPPGARVLAFAFDDAVEGSARVATTLTVTHAPVLALDATSVVRGRPTLVTGRVGSDDAPLARQPVLLRFDEATARVVTDDEGRFGRAFHPTRIGPVEVSVLYAGSIDGVFLSVNASRTLVARDAPAIHVLEDSLVRGDPVLKAAVVAATGEPLPRVPVRVRGAWGDLRTMTGDDGALAVSLPLAVASVPGPIDVVLAVEEGPLVEAALLETRLAVVERGTLAVDVPRWVAPGGTIRGRVDLVDPSGAPLAFAAASVRFDGRVVHRGPGPAFAFDVPGSAEPGSHALVVEVEAPFVSAPAFAGSIDVVAPVGLAIVSTTPGRAGEPMLARIVARADGRPVPNATLLVEGLGSSPWRFTTDAGGEAVVSIPASRLDEARYRVRHENASAGGDVLVLTIVPSGVAPPGRDLAAPAALALAVLAAAIAAAWRRWPRATAAPVLAAAARRLRRDDPDYAALYEVYLELAALAKLTDEAAETLGFAEVAARATGDRAEDRADVAILTGAFNDVVYAEAHDPGVALAAADALDRILARGLPGGIR